jgi:hypothetical protein
VERFERGLPDLSHGLPTRSKARRRRR